MNQLKVTRFSVKDLLAAAVKNEIESKKIYYTLAGQVKNVFLKDRFDFLAHEEEKHQAALEKMFKELFAPDRLVIPEKNVVPLPEIKFQDEWVPLSTVLLSAMKAEEAAHHFYLQLADRFASDQEKKDLLLYFASMEMGHFRLLEIEKENQDRFEQLGLEQEMIHVGP